jgi:tRNA pseudouridine38-40 synthase
MTDTTTNRYMNYSQENAQVQRLALLVEYCGTVFHGSQFQPQQATVQGSLEKAVEQLGLVGASAVSFASRTDAGVHALGQVAHFDVPPAALKNIQDLASALNAVLPDSISVRDIHLGLDRTFNSRRDAAAKWYRYKIYNSKNRSVWALRNAALLHRTRLDAERMNQAASQLLGEHDFTSFKDLGSPEINTLCDIKHVQVARDGDMIILDIVANRFLYKMVRNLVAQLMVIGDTRRYVSTEDTTLLDLLHSRDRLKVPPGAPAEGLTLMAVSYKSPFKLFEKDVYVQQLKNILKPMESSQNENIFRKAS